MLRCVPRMSFVVNKCLTSQHYCKLWDAMILASLVCCYLSYVQANKMVAWLILIHIKGCAYA